MMARRAWHPGHPCFWASLARSSKAAGGGHPIQSTVPTDTIHTLAMSYETTLFIAQVLMPAVFLFAFGACVGSLTNVLVYRMPLGLSVVSPPSRCPACETRLTWRENIPIFGWIFLRGRCRFCKSHISPEYPLVELFVALAFTAFFVLWYAVPDNAVWLDLPVGMIKRDWVRGYGAVEATWPIFGLMLCLLSCLIAMTLVDAKTFTIPMGLSLTPAYAALVVHPLWAIYIQLTKGTLPSTATGMHAGMMWNWTLPTPGNYWWLGAPLGAGIGLIVSLLMLRFGFIRRSFEDFETWEQEQLKALEAKKSGSGENLSEGVEKAEAAAQEKEQPKVLRDLGLTLAIATVLGVVGTLAASALQQPQWVGTAAGVAAGVVIAALIARRLDGPQSGEPEQNQAEQWTEYPHARREMLKELAFLGPIGLGGFLGGTLFEYLAKEGHAPPSWLALQVLSGVVLGYLVGGGVVWLVRIGGSLAFGREAMGMGDVHMMAGVGACLGWIDVTLAFFAGAFVGVVWAVFALVRFGTARRAMPFGPFLAVGTVVVVVCKPWFEGTLSVLLPHLSPIKLP